MVLRHPNRFAANVFFFSFFFFFISSLPLYCMREALPLLLLLLFFSSLLFLIQFRFITRSLAHFATFHAQLLFLIFFFRISAIEWLSSSCVNLCEFCFFFFIALLFCLWFHVHFSCATFTVFRHCFRALLSVHANIRQFIILLFLTIKKKRTWSLYVYWWCVKFIFRFLASYVNKIGMFVLRSLAEALNKSLVPNTSWLLMVCCCCCCVCLWRASVITTNMYICFGWCELL